MVKAWQIEKALDEFAPKSTALSYDNVGLLIGDPQADVDRVLIALDITPDTMLEAEMRRVSLIISHHPIIFNPYRTITDATYDKSAAMRLIRSGITAICMHTNLDLARGGVNDALAEALELTDIETVEGDPDKLLRVGMLRDEMEMEDFAEKVRQRLGCPGLWYSDAKMPVRRVAVCGGAGGGEEELALAISAGADVYISSEFHHHVTLQAEYKHISLIDAGHFYTEQPVLYALEYHLRNLFPQLNIYVSPMTPSGKYITE